MGRRMNIRGFRSARENIVEEPFVNCSIESSKQGVVALTNSRKTVSIDREPGNISSWIFMIAIVFCFGSTTSLFAQQPIPSSEIDDSGSFSIGGAEPDYLSIAPSSAQTAGRGFGGWARFGHIAGKTVGRDDSITHIELFPYLFVQDGAIFGDVRFFRTNDAGFGMNTGLGYRHYFENLDRFIGLTFWYDSDRTRDADFEQLALSVETLGEFFDWRMNFYLPVGDRSQQLDLFVTPGTTRFQDNNIVFDLTDVQGAAMKGLDMELAVPVRHPVALRHNVRIAAGWYHFQEEGISSIWGWKGRLEGNLIPSVDLNLEVTSDDFFDTLVQFGAAWTFDPLGSREETRRRSTMDRMTLPVRRNYTVVISDDAQQIPDQIAIDANDGLPIIVQHVDSNAAGPGNGTVQDPFTIIQDAQGIAGTDIIFVHADSAFNGADAQIFSEADVRILGEGDGVDHFIDVVGLGPILVPRATGGFARPTLSNSPGAGVVLANGSEFSGFQIIDPTDQGILANNVNASQVRFVDVLNAGGSGIELDNSSGVFFFEQNLVDNATGNAFDVDGGNAAITFVDNIINNSSNRIVEVTNTTGGFVNMSGSVLNDTGGTGILIDSIAGSVTVDNATIIDSTDRGVDIQNMLASGAASFIDLIVTNSAFESFNLENSLGTVTATDGADDADAFAMNINNRNDIGLNIRGFDGTATFFNTVQLNGVNSGDFSGVEFQDSDGDVTFTTLTIIGSGVTGGLVNPGFGGRGINIGEVGTDNTGSFTVVNATNIDQTLDIALAIQDDQSTVDFQSGVAIGSRGLEGIVITDNAGTVDFGGLALVNNLGTNGVTSNESAIILNDNTGEITFNAINVLNHVFADAVSVNNNLATVDLGDISVQSTQGNGLVATNNFLLSASGGVFDVIQDRAIDIDTSDLAFSVDSVSVIQSDFGILVTNSTGSFNVLGGGNDGDGGTINQTDIGVGIFDAALNDANLIDVSLSDMIIQNGTVPLLGGEGTGAGVELVNVDEFSADNMTFTDNDDHAIDALNVRVFDLTNSTLDNNADAAGEATVRLRADELLDVDGNINIVESDEIYTWTFDNNRVTDLNGEDIFQIVNLVGAEGAPLQLVMDDHVDLTDPLNPQVGILTDNDGDAVLEVDWNGPLDVTVTDNFIQLTQDVELGEYRAVDISNTSQVDLSAVTINNNIFNSVSPIGFDTALLFNFLNEADIAIDFNTITMDGLGNAGMEFTLAADSTVSITNNLHIDNGDDGIAIFFPTVAGPSTFTLENNNLNLADSALDGFERGIFFQTVIGTITLDPGTGLDNTVIFNPFNFGSQIDFQNNGVANGFIFVNGAQRTN